MSLRDLILKNLGLKIFSLVLATLVWLSVQANEQAGGHLPVNPFGRRPTRDFRRPVTVLNESSRAGLFRVDPNEVTVRVSGEAAVLKQLSPREIQVYLRVTDQSDAQSLLPLEVNLPPEAGLQQVWPARVRVETGRPN